MHAYVLRHTCASQRLESYALSLQAFAKQLSTSMIYDLVEVLDYLLIYSLQQLYGTLYLPTSNYYYRNSFLAY